MRILPLGDGVVLGSGASGGFRAPLEEILSAASIDFEFVGRRTENSFEMSHPNHEGWERATLTSLRDEHLEPALSFAPDTVLIYAGAEDLRTLPDAGIAVARLQKLAKSIHDASPECKIICSQLIPSRDYGAEQKVKKFNTGLGTMVETLSSKGMPISRVKMHAKVKAENLNEHGMPVETGYLAMAQVWFQKIEEIHRRKSEPNRGE